ncbi:carbonic anhydrase 1 isoform X1 [Drosophila sechellia]|uniref:carbonic anhydrase 1 isoform X1 n=1 Tax=Drosophila sechellia TaxID=7238 RepID=UPI0013DE296D|nr:carbonic anhydrase 1 isoform X1 [Drosophila sechellia]
MLLPMIDLCWLKFIRAFGLMMQLAEESRLIMMLISCTMAVAFIVNVCSGRTIFQDLCNAVGSRRLETNLAMQPSPITIPVSNIIKRHLKMPLQWTYYDDLPMATVLKNNGSTVIMRIYTAYNFMPQLSGANLLGRYHFVEAIFKWGSLKSEHSIDNYHFSLELQALHRCAQLENNLEYLTLSYLFELSCVKNEHLMEVTDQLKWISQPGSSMELPPFHLGSLLQPFGSDYFSYEGTYDNGDVVLPTTWLISRNISVVNWRQLGEFEALYGRNGNRNCKNGREQQALGNRNVYLNM